ncbi:hypothetical protein V6N12_002096 [Hibiscus sabdariffa]|uniref:Uncharacterized protein n=1 Tax=Hibiscus sabdariffa TaxID=183260 RepID=A0ABR2AQD8_9ROSI
MLDRGVIFYSSVRSCKSPELRSVLAVLLGFRGVSDMRVWSCWNRYYASTVDVYVVCQLLNQTFVVSSYLKSNYEHELVEIQEFCLLLPVGTVIRLLTKQGMVGCLGNLYQSVENLGDAYILPTTSRDTLLKPTYSSSLATNVPLLLPHIQSSKPQGLYRCSYRHNTACRSYYTDDPTASCPSCGNVMNSTVTHVNPPNKVSTASSAANEMRVDT